MNIECIMQAKIPDMAIVYGGVRGRTMSSRHQTHAWNALMKSGIKQVIDLRQDYHSDKYKEVCSLYAMRYFQYPVGKGREYVSMMVEQFPTFCELIDQGDFFISCAQGLHRTDIALCLYWVFYGADKGLMPPVLVGYLVEKRHDAGKIMFMLNAFYKYKTERDGKEPIPIELFKERKKVIWQISETRSDG